MINKLKKQAGFTILESIFAILILSLSISGVFSAVQQGLSQATIAKDEVKAFYLAQEAVEIIRNRRDDNQLNIKLYNAPITWLSGITDASNCPFNKVCRANASGTSLTLCGNNWGDCPVLKQDQTTFLYNYTSGNDTNFKREIQLESINANEIAITVRVSWTKGSLPPFVFKAKTLLFNWI